MVQSFGSQILENTKHLVFISLAQGFSATTKHPVVFGSAQGSGANTKHSMLISSIHGSSGKHQKKPWCLLQSRDPQQAPSTYGGSICQRVFSKQKSFHVAAFDPSKHQRDVEQASSTHIVRPKDPKKSTPKRVVFSSVKGS